MWIFMSDLHLTSKPADEYRWTFLSEFLQQPIAHNTRIFVLGDLTEAKDNHPAVLVNRLVDYFAVLAAKVKRIYILKGNHDGVSGVAYFEFLKHIPNISVITKPTTIRITGRKVALLPHTLKPLVDWGALEFSELNVALMHITARGAVSESGHTLEGTDLKWLRSYIFCRFFSGDIHVPQRVGNIEYVGAPYPIRFGDNFKGRIILFDPLTMVPEDWHFPSILKAKLTIKSAKKLNWEPLRSGDQIKVVLDLGPEELHEWAKRKQDVVDWCREHKVILAGVELLKHPQASGKPDTPMKLPGHKQAFRSYCNTNKVPDSTISVGKTLLKRAELDN